MGGRTRNKVLFASSVFLGLAVVLGFPLHLSKLKLNIAIPKGSIHGIELRAIIQVARGVGTAFCALAFLMCLDICRMNPANSHTFYTLYFQYKVLLILRFWRPYYKIWGAMKLSNPKKACDDNLMRILRWNKTSAYGTYHKFNEIKTREDFVRMHPITTYTQYKPYVDRAAKGEENVLFCDKVICLMETSATGGGTPKMYPYSYQSRKHFYNASPLGVYTYMHMRNMQRYAQFHLFTADIRSSGHIPVCGYSQFILAFPPHNLIPRVYAKLHTEDSSYYAQGIFLIAEREVRYISGFSADSMLAYWRFITHHWEEMCDDITVGKIGDHVAMPEDVRKQLSKCLKADPDRANQLRRAMVDGPIEIAKRIWPSVEFVVLGKSAGFKMSIGLLRAKFLKGLKIIDLVHIGTEGVIGVNLNTKDPENDDSLTLAVFGESFLEFIPLKDVDQVNPTTAFVEELQLGELYEVVQTNLSGHYRNRTGDIIKIVGFNKKTPRYEFLYKIGQCLNISLERTPDMYLIATVQKHTAALADNVRLINFTSTESTFLDDILGEKTGKAHYVFLMEFSTDAPIEEEELAKKMELTLMDLHYEYKRYKHSGSIGELQVIQVHPGTFAGLKDILWDNRPHSQFKWPRVLRKEPALRFLMDRTLKGDAERA